MTQPAIAANEQHAESTASPWPGIAFSIAGGLAVTIGAILLIIGMATTAPEMAELAPAAAAETV